MDDEVRRDFENLLGTCQPFAERMLREAGEFFPFAASVGVDGKVASVAADFGDERPKSNDAISFLNGALKAQAAAGEIRATCVCYDGRTVPPGQSEKSEAVICQMEHRNEPASAIVLPYVRTDNDVTLGAAFRVPVPAAVFT